MRIQLSDLNFSNGQFPWLRPECITVCAKTMLLMDTSSQWLNVVEVEIPWKKDILSGDFGLSTPQGPFGLPLDDPKVLRINSNHLSFRYNQCFLCSFMACITPWKANLTVRFINPSWIYQLSDPIFLRPYMISPNMKRNIRKIF